MIFYDLFPPLSFECPLGYYDISLLASLKLILLEGFPVTVFRWYKTRKLRKIVLLLSSTYNSFLYCYVIISLSLSCYRFSHALKARTLFHSQLRMVEALQFDENGILQLCFLETLIFWSKFQIFEQKVQIVSNNQKNKGNRKVKKKWQSLNSCI